MQQALSSCTGFAPSPWPFLSGLVFSLSVVPFFTAYAVLFTFLPLTNTTTHTHSPFAKQFFLLHLLLFRAVSIFLFCLLLPFATLSLCFMLRQMTLLCCWNFLFVDFSLFLSTLIASFCTFFPLLLILSRVFPGAACVFACAKRFVSLLGTHQHCQTWMKWKFCANFLKRRSYSNDSIAVHKVNPLTQL